MITKDQYRFIREHVAFKNIRQEQFDELSKFIQYRRIPKDQILFFTGDTRDKFFLIYSGYVRIEQYDASDNYLYVDFVKPEALFPYGGVFQDEEYHYTAVAITDLECFYIPRELFETFSLKSTEQMAFLCSKLSQILRLHELRLRNMINSSATDRVIQSLAVLLFDVCGEESVLPFPITILELAKLSGTTRETVSQVMKRLKRKNIITYSHKRLTYMNRNVFLENLY
ncbi:cyclic nucleotide-binding domain-containing protein [Granulicatella sp. zg-ZJ]|uniref:Crp/Fnr family transcriptional regulator n=1 Tax=unclassified Granulicatella TaxID=2630493 RepID=UPI0013BED8DD|nr:MULTISPECIES: Crp/Fnr family transcriptional regulator [unclassified Granulicatella]NEW63263.1 cyclic nucleotide-binding domain-containing protein [Granulicatella sp. zg-ZJ]NEW66743.1 cyclic nucleotide-binding domain-containing protein [Granulicatella sp. zg-84]QMI85413.1 Crp/Fnr family transcriptional regulator [Carnobacteriaceae bacterium zg-84]